ncbi:MAG: hypothetical protein ACI4PD_07075, partial [Butyricicoccus sp.]
MDALKERLEENLRLLDAGIYINRRTVETVLFRDGQVEEFHQEFDMDLSAYRPYAQTDCWVGQDIYGVFRLTVAPSPEQVGRPLAVLITTGCEGGWDARNPQFIVWT